MMKYQFMLFLTTTVTAVQFHGAARGYNAAYHSHPSYHKWLWFVVLLPTTTATLSYRGTDTGFQVTCPLKDFLSNPCTPTLVVPADDCPVLQLCSQDYTPPSDSSIVVIPMTCSCLQLTNCPDSCTSDGDGSEVFSAAPQNETRIDFQGPGTVTCDMNDFLVRPCLPVKTDGCEDDAAAYRNNCDTYFVPPEEENAETVEIPLPCACLSMYNCPASCVFQPPIDDEVVDNDPEDLTATVGPTEKPVENEVVDDDPEDVTATDVPTVTPEVDEEPVDDAGKDVPEETTVVEDQPEEDNSVAVEPSEGDSSTTVEKDPIDTGLLSFRGPGVVVCPITAYKENPCCKSHGWFFLAKPLQTVSVVQFDSTILYSQHLSIQSPRL